MYVQLNSDAGSFEIFTNSDVPKVAVDDKREAERRAFALDLISPGTGGYVSTHEQGKAYPLAHDVIPQMAVHVLEQAGIEVIHPAAE